MGYQLFDWLWQGVILPGHQLLVDWSLIIFIVAIVLLLRETRSFSGAVGAFGLFVSWTLAFLYPLNVVSRFTILVLAGAMLVTAKNRLQYELRRRHAHSRPLGWELLAYPKKVLAGVLHLYESYLQQAANRRALADLYAHQRLARENGQEQPLVKKQIE